MKKSSLIILSGLPGTGKSAIGEKLAKHFSIPIFAKDWLEATLLTGGLDPKLNNTGSIGYQLLSTLIDRQLKLNQSVIVDSVATTASISTTWFRLARKYGVQVKIIECICSDKNLHQSRLLNRSRNIPGWHELVWSDVLRAKSYYRPWTKKRLVLDAVDPFEDNFQKVLKYITD